MKAATKTKARPKKSSAAQAPNTYETPSALRQQETAYQLNRRLLGLVKVVASVSGHDGHRWLSKENVGHSYFMVVDFLRDQKFEGLDDRLNMPLQIVRQLRRLISELTEVVVLAEEAAKDPAWEGGAV